MLVNMIVKMNLSISTGEVDTQLETLEDLTKNEMDPQQFADWLYQAFGFSTEEIEGSDMEANTEGYEVHTTSVRALSFESALCPAAWSGCQWASSPPTPKCDERVLRFVSRLNTESLCTHPE